MGISKHLSIFRVRATAASTLVLNAVSSAALTASLSYTAPALAHEFWMMPRPSAVAIGGTTQLTLNVGENFKGEVVPFSRQYVAALRHYRRGKEVDLLPRVADSPSVGEFALRFDTGGTHLLTYEGHPNRITLGPDKFHAYLQMEGLEHIVRSREAAGTANQPARELYRRYVKTLIEVGGDSDQTHTKQTGQRFEILPISSHLPTARPGDRLTLQLLYEQKPLANALVKAWHLRGNQQLVIQIRTDAAGKFNIELPYPGVWMLSAVHMIPAADPATDDWESLWSNLTFVLKPKI
ncbi:MAG: DUF4198 domain-containing protein [Pseudomonadota bacterium]